MGGSSSRRRHSASLSPCRMRPRRPEPNPKVLLSVPREGCIPMKPKLIAMRASHWLTKLCWIGTLICLTGYDSVAKSAEGSYVLVGEGFEQVILRVESKFLARARKSAVSGDFEYVNIVFFLADAKGRFEAQTIRSVAEQRSYLQQQDNLDQWIEEVLRTGVDVGITLGVANSAEVFEITHKKLGIDDSGEFER